MPITLNDAIRRVRSALDEPAYPSLPGSTSDPTLYPQARFYSDTELTDWVNDGLRDIARRAETLLTRDTTVALPAYGENPSQPPPMYPLNLGPIPTGSPATYSDIVRINRVEFQVANDSSQIYPLEPSTRQYLDNIWNIDQLSTMSYPAYWVTAGYPGGVGRSAFQIQVFPNPAQAGQLNIFYYRLPLRITDPVATPANYALNLDIIEGWDDLIVDYSHMRGLIKARNSDWQALQAIYESKVNNIIDQTRHFHDQPAYITYDTMIMPWAYDSWGGF